MSKVTQSVMASLINVTPFHTQAYLLSYVPLRVEIPYDCHLSNIRKFKHSQAVQKMTLDTPAFLGTMDTLLGRVSNKAG